MDDKYEYQCNIIDSLGNKLAFIEYKSSNYTYYLDFPDSLSQIRVHQFEKNLLYNKGQKFQKINFKYVKKGDDYIHKLIRFERKVGLWIEKEITTAKNAYKVLAQHLGIKGFYSDMRNH